MKKILTISFLLLFTLTTGWSQELNLIKERVVDHLLKTSSYDQLLRDRFSQLYPDGPKTDLCMKELFAHVQNNDRDAEKVCNRLNHDGSWSAVDYKSKSRSDWAPQQHVDNILVLVKAYRNSSSKFYCEKKMRESIFKAIAYWEDNKFKCSNWWFNEVGMPKSWAPIILLLADELYDTQKRHFLSYLADSRIENKTGQNKVWVADILCLKALIENDAVAFAKYAKALRDEVIITPQEGLQSDFSFHQHGAQLQFGNYGLSFASSVSTWMKILAGTEYDFTKDQKEIMRNYFLQGLRRTVWKGNMDVSACGRQLFYNTSEGKALALLLACNNMMVADGEYQKEYEKYITDNFSNTSVQSEKGNFVFNKSKYTIHRTDAFLVTVKMCSDKVIGGETTNQENLQGYHLADGAMFIYLDGREYKNIFPLWNGKSIPGTTLEKNEQQLKVLKGNEYLNGNGFVGGVSDGLLGVTAMRYDRDGVEAQKSWFFLGDIVCCVANGIKSRNGYPLVTTINQTNKKGKVAYVRSRNVWETAQSDSTSSRRLHHGSIGYLSLDKTPIRFSLKEHRGNWNDIAHFYPSKEERGDIFTAEIEHPRGTIGSYAYLVFPAVEKKQFFKMTTERDISILENNENATVVEDCKTKTLLAVFWKPGKIKSPIYGTIESAHAGMIIVSGGHKSIRYQSYTPEKGSFPITIDQKSY